MYLSISFKISVILLNRRYIFRIIYQKTIIFSLHLNPFNIYSNVKVLLIIDYDRLLYLILIIKMLFGLLEWVQTDRILIGWAIILVCIMNFLYINQFVFWSLFIKIASEATL